MTSQKIVSYVINTPNNTNPVILKQMLKDITSSGNIDQIEPAEDDIPKVFFGDELPQLKADTVMSFRYISKTEDISGYCVTKAQGNSSMGFPKKNQTVKLYKDAECTEKLKVDFKGWGKQNKFCFKANWVDLTHARNIVSARLWGDVVKSRVNYESIPKLLRTSPNQGAVDGFPVKVYAKGVYQGRYTINIPKDAWMANMDDELDAHCILCGENYESACFRAEAAIDGSDWTDEIHDIVPDAIKARWNEAIRFVMNSTDEEFVSGIGNYFDIESLIDYFVFGIVICNMDGFGKNQLFDTYDGQKWYATVYDLDSVFGTYFNIILADDYPRSSFEDYKDGARQGNLLYMRLEELFAEEIKTRYAELKQGALSLTNIINRFERFTDIAPADLVKEDYAATTADGAFTTIPLQEQSNIQQIRNYIVKRYAYVDAYMLELGTRGSLLYNLDAPLVVNGTGWSGYIEDTGIKLFDEPKSFTLICEAILDDDCASGKILWGCSNEYIGWTDPSTGAGFFDAKTHVDGGLYFTGVPNTWSTPIFGSYAEGEAAIKSRYSKHAVVVENGVPTDLYFITEVGGKVQHMKPAHPLTYFQHEGILSIGIGRYSYGGNNPIDGTIHSFEIWDYAMTAEEIAEKFNQQQASGILYELPQETTFNGIDDYIDTGLAVMNEARSFTIIVDYTEAENVAKNGKVFSCVQDHGGGSYGGLALWKYPYSESNGYFVGGFPGNGEGYLFNSPFNSGLANERMSVAIVFEDGVPARMFYKNSNGEVLNSIMNAAVTEKYPFIHARNILLGCREYGSLYENKGNFWAGTIHTFEVWDYAMNEQEILKKLTGE